VGQEVAHRDGLLARSLKARQELLYGLIQVELLFIYEDHGHGRGGHHLGEAGEVIERVGGHRRRVRVIGEPAERVQVDQGAAMADRENAARTGASLLEAFEKAVDFVESLELLGL
jgi:hypothetical protein